MLHYLWQMNKWTVPSRTTPFLHLSHLRFEFTQPNAATRRAFSFGSRALRLCVSGLNTFLLINIAPKRPILCSTMAEYIRIILLYFLSLVYWTSGQRWNVTFVPCMSYTSLAYSYDYYGPAIDMAILDLREQYPHIGWKKLTRSPRSIKTCAQQDAQGLSIITDFLYNEPTGSEIWHTPGNLIVIISNGCSGSLRYVGDLSREINIPVISSGGSSNVLSNTERFPTMLRLLPYQQNDLVKTTTLFLTRHRWTDIVLLCDVNPSLGNFFTVACQGFQDGILQMPGTNLMSYNFDTRTGVDYAHYLTLGSLRSRVFVIVAHGNITRNIMIQANHLKMTNGDYVYVSTYPLEHPLYGFYKWRFEDEDDDAAKEAFQSLYFVSTRPIRGPDYRSFEVELKYRAYKEYQFMYAADERVSAFTALQHTVVSFAGDIINETLRETGVINDGKTIMRKAFERRNVSSVTGDFIIDNGDRVQYVYVIVGMEHHTYTFKEYFEFDTTVRKLARTPGQRLEWAYRQDAPPNTPFCGFDGSDLRCSNALSITVGIICGLIAAALVLGLTVYCVAKHTKSNVELDDPRWSIPRDEINFLNLQNNMSASQTASRNIGSTVTKSKSQYSVRTGLNSQVSGSRVTKGTRGSGMTNSVTKDAHVAKWKNKLVWVHEIKLGHKFSPSGAQEDLIRKMKRINGTNVAHFYGFSPHDGVEIGVLCEIVARGSMTDIMASDKVKFDVALKNSVIRDLTNGLLYLHDSLIGHHGEVNCGNCLLDNRFVLKLAYFRLDFLPRATPSSQNEENEYRQFLSFAPEQLRAPITHIFRGSKEADVYSYGHTLYNLVAEVEPFEEEMNEHNFTPKAILDKVITQSIIAFRPRIPNGMERTLRTIIEQCWDDKPLNRPTMKTVDRLLKTIPGFQLETNFVDSLLQRMSQYAEELESRIATATAGMIEEKKKSEELLFQVLPRHLALALTQGRKIEPESFSAVTIGFTAIANFGDVALQSTPMQIVNLLNDLYSMFDATLELFDVYKVETISDSYMIASGLPERNGDEHSRQIAKVSLELMTESDNFKIRHRPNERLELKIGFHTGACAAGIVGSKMPRYCLFGDTINTASRMTSFGKPLKIQVSTPAKEHLDRFKEFRFAFRGLVEIKGKGQQPCYWLLRKNEEADAHSEEKWANPLPALT